jgi:hypothetical protein
MHARTRARTHTHTHFTLVHLGTRTAKALSYYMMHWLFLLQGTAIPRHDLWLFVCIMQEN